MERLHRLGLTWVLVCLVSIFGTLWTYGEELEVSEKVPELRAEAAVLVDGDTGRILFSENGKVPMAMASTTKIMTCLIALEHTKPKDIVTISKYAASMPDVQLDAVEGDTFYIEDLLYSLMLESHNDVAVAIAEHVAGSEEKFSEMMNLRANALGCKQTKFVTANGLDAAGHYTTAEELAIITIEALKNDIFKKIIKTPEYSFTNVEGTRTYYVNNKNSFLHQIEGAYGVKTGFTNDAGYCFVGAAVQEDKNLISVVLRSGWPPNKEWKWQDTIKLMNYGFESYTYREIGMNNIEAGTLKIKDGLINEVILRTDTKIEKILLKDTDKVTIRMIKELERKAPVEKGTIVGWVYYLVNQMPVKKYPIYVQETVNKKTYLDCLENIRLIWLLF